MPQRQTPSTEQLVDALRPTLASVAVVPASAAQLADALQVLALEVAEQSAPPLAIAGFFARLAESYMLKASHGELAPQSRSSSTVDRAANEVLGAAVKTLTDEGYDLDAVQRAMLGQLALAAATTQGGASAGEALYRLADLVAAPPTQKPN